MHIIFKQLSTTIDYSHFLKENGIPRPGLPPSRSFTEYVPLDAGMLGGKNTAPIAELINLIVGNHPNAYYEKSDLGMGRLIEQPDGVPQFLPLRQLVFDYPWMEFYPETFGRSEAKKKLLNILQYIISGTLFLPYLVNAGSNGDSYDEFQPADKYIDKISKGVKATFVIIYAADDDSSKEFPLAFMVYDYDSSPDTRHGVQVRIPALYSLVPGLGSVLRQHAFLSLPDYDKRIQYYSSLDTVQPSMAVMGSPVFARMFMEMKIMMERGNSIKDRGLYVLWFPPLVDMYKELEDEFARSASDKDILMPPGEVDDHYKVFNTVALGQIVDPLPTELPNSNPKPFYYYSMLAKNVLERNMLPNEFYKELMVINSKMIYIVRLNLYRAHLLRFMSRESEPVQPNLDYLPHIFELLYYYLVKYLCMVVSEVVIHDDDALPICDEFKVYRTELYARLVTDGYLEVVDDGSTVDSSDTFFTFDGISYKLQASKFSGYIKLLNVVKILELFIELEQENQVNHDQLSFFPSATDKWWCDHDINPENVDSMNQVIERLCRVSGVPARNLPDMFRSQIEHSSNTREFKFAVKAMPLQRSHFQQAMDAHETNRATASRISRCFTGCFGERGTMFSLLCCSTVGVRRLLKPLWPPCATFFSCCRQPCVTDVVKKEDNLLALLTYMLMKRFYFSTKENDRGGRDAISLYIMGQMIQRQDIEIRFNQQLTKVMKESNRLFVESLEYIFGFQDVFPIRKKVLDLLCSLDQISLYPPSKFRQKIEVSKKTALYLMGFELGKLKGLRAAPGLESGGPFLFHKSVRCFARLKEQTTYSKEGRSRSSSAGTRGDIRKWAIGGDYICKKLDPFASSFFLDRKEFSSFKTPFLTKELVSAYESGDTTRINLLTSELNDHFESAVPSVWEALNSPIEFYKLMINLSLHLDVNDSNTLTLIGSDRFRREFSLRVPISFLDMLLADDSQTFFSKNEKLVLIRGLTRTHFETLATPDLLDQKTFSWEHDLRGQAYFDRLKRKLVEYNDATDDNDLIEALKTENAWFSENFFPRSFLHYLCGFNCGSYMTIQGVDTLYASVLDIVLEAVPEAVLEDVDKYKRLMIQQKRVGELGPSTDERVSALEKELEALQDVPPLVRKTKIRINEDYDDKPMVEEAIYRKMMYLLKMVPDGNPVSYSAIYESCRDEMVERRGGMVFFTESGMRQTTIRPFQCSDLLGMMLQKFDTNGAFIKSLSATFRRVLSRCQSETESKIDLLIERQAAWSEDSSKSRLDEASGSSLFYRVKSTVDGWGLDYSKLVIPPGDLFYVSPQPVGKLPSLSFNEFLNITAYLTYRILIDPARDGQKVTYFRDPDRLANLLLLFGKEFHVIFNDVEIKAKLLGGEEKYQTICSNVLDSLLEYCFFDGEKYKEIAEAVINGLDKQQMEYCEGGALQVSVDQGEEKSSLGDGKYLGYFDGVVNELCSVSGSQLSSVEEFGQEWIDDVNVLTQRQQSIENLINHLTHMITMLESDPKFLEYVTLNILFSRLLFTSDRQELFSALEEGMGITFHELDYLSYL